MLALLGLLLLVVEPPELTADVEPQPQFDIRVHIVEFKPIKGVTKETSDAEVHLHIKPALVVTPADVISVEKRTLRGPTFGTRETGFKHYPLLRASIQLNDVAKLRLKEAVLDARSLTTTRSPVVGVVVNGNYDGTWTKFILDDPTSSVYWNRFAPRISCTGNEERADRLIEQFAPSKEH